MDRWVKYSLLVKISEKMNQHRFNLSKMSLQELVFLLSELFSVSSGYDFKLYTYGPYSVELISDLDYLFSSGALKIQYVNDDSYTGSKIIPGENYSEILSRVAEYLSKNEEEIDRVIDLFGKYTAHELELMAAIVYVMKRENMDETNLIDRIREVKPYFSPDKIGAALTDLKDMDLL